MEALISMVGSICGSIAGIATENAVGPIAQQLGYLFKHKAKFQNLRIKLQELKAAGERVEQSVSEAQRNGEVIFPHVQIWLKEVTEKISDHAAAQLDEDEEKSKRRCFAGCCPDFKSRHQLSRKAQKETDTIAQLLNQKDGFDRVSYRPSVEEIGVNRHVKDFEAFESRNGAFNEVMAALGDGNVDKVGVYGMGGVGKTTLVKEVAAQAKEKLSFSEVVFVAVTQTPNMTDIQTKLAEKLGLKIDETGMDVRAGRLRERLKEEKNVLIILDDIWVKLELETLGVPTTDEHKGCKILVTSRSLDVLKSMDTRQNVSIETLKDDEALQLFKNMAGDIVERPDLQSTAVEVAKRCAGLPIAIATIAKALKHKQDSFEWRSALRELSNPSKANFKGIPKEAYSAIEMSYKFIENEELQPIFLLCSIMGHDADIEVLLRYARGLGLLHGVNTIKDARDKVLSLVNNLKASCLLLDGSHPTRFDMHDVVHDVAISIASRDYGWLVSTEEDVFEVWSDEDIIRKCKLLSLRSAKASDLPNELECPLLTFFSMHASEDIPSDFFKGMQRLKVLDFAEMRFSSLPSSIGSLKTLCTLRLIDCVLGDIASLGELKNLKMLDLCGSRVAMLPKEIGQLNRLKLLDLSYCGRLEVIAPDVLSSLSSLEELYLYCNFDGWEVEGIYNPRSNASLVELQHLSHLITLEVHIRDVEAIPKDDMFFGKLERYKIAVGDKRWYEWDHGRRMKTSRMLKFNMKTSNNLYDGTKLLLRKAQSLHLERVEDVRKMLYDPITEGFPDLKYLHIRDVLDIKVLLNSMMPVPCLELTDLEAICDRQLKVGSFDLLRIIEVENCKTLKNLFFFPIITKFCQLEEVVVFDCHSMTGLIVEEEKMGENEIMEFRQLRSLELRSLCSFNGMWYSEKTSEFATWLFDEKVSCPALEFLELDSVSGIEKIWNDDLGVQSLTILIVTKCHKLKYVFTSSMVKSFSQLETLDVSECDEMEEIIQGMLGEEERASSCITLFPKLDSLELKCLPNLKRFCCGNNIPIEFPSLRELTLKECPDLNTFHCESTNIGGKSSGNISLDQPQHLFNEKTTLPALEKLVISYWDSLERLWPSQAAQHSFSKLTSIVLGDCDKLLDVFPLCMLTRLQGLNRLSICDCESLEEIIYESQPQEEEGSSSRAMQSFSPQPIRSAVITYEFPLLTSLILGCLPNLRSIHRKMLSINWPSLKEMEVWGCDKVEILFACEETSGFPIEQPLFWVNQFTFPKLHMLTLGLNAGMKEIWHSDGQQLVSHYFPNLKAVKIDSYTVQVLPLPSYLFSVLSSPNIQTLIIKNSSLKEVMFQCEEGCEEKSAWVGKINLIPSSVSFRNLVTLKVEQCNGIIKLITHSTAKSLVQLRKMSIFDCQDIEEIIEGGDDDDDNISFPQLNSLRLERLEKLQSFCSSRNYTFGFPSLQTVVVERCPRMKIFSHGHSNTPMLHKVLLHYRTNAGLWKGSLNSTIQQLFRVKNYMTKEADIIQEDESSPSTFNTQNYMTEKAEIIQEDQSNPSTSA